MSFSATDRVDLPEKLAVRAKPRQPERVGIGFAVDQQQVRLDVTFPVARLIAAKIMIVVFGVKRLVARQSRENRF